MNRRRSSGSDLLSLVLLAVCVHCTYVAGGTATRIRTQDLPCEGVGPFIFPDSCQDYYECKIFRGSIHRVPRRCPPGTNFDDVFSECKPKYSVTSPPRCVQNAALGMEEPVEASVNGSSVDVIVDELSVDAVVNGSQVVASNTTVYDISEGIHLDLEPTEGNVTGNGTAVFEDFGADGQDVNVTSVPLVNNTLTVNSTEETVVVQDLTLCEHMNVVNSYTTLAISNPFLQESFPYQKQYNENVMKYNVDLEKAKNNTALWRRGDSILFGIKKTVQVASEHKRNFDTKFMIYQGRKVELSEAELDSKFVDSITADIKTLREEIKTSQEALGLSDVSAVRQYFEGVITSKLQTIERKEQQIKFSGKAASILQELLHFLGYVKDDAKEVEDLAKQVGENMDSFYGTMEGDVLAFSKYVNRADEGIRILTEEKETKQEELRIIRTRQEEVENRKKELTEILDPLNDENFNISRVIFRLTNIMDNKTKIYNRKKDIICNPNGVEMSIHVNKSSTDLEKIQACNLLLEENNVSLDLSEELLKVETLRDKKNNNGKKIAKILEELEPLTTLSHQLYGTLPNHEPRIHQIDLELASVQIHRADLRNLEEGVGAAMRSLSELRESFRGLGDMFESLTSDFESMIAQTSGAEGEAIIDQERMAIEHRVSNAQNDMGVLEVLDLGTCTMSQ